MKTPCDILRVLGVLAIGVLPIRIASAASFVWNGDSADANWGTGTNLNGGIATAHDGTAVIVLSGTNHLTLNVDVAWDIGSLASKNNAGELK